ncbi:MAG: hypothetical protein IKH20_11505 [Clostridiales bacterium]|nr:hypothetical protein [Clostridiales bacterium]
MLYNKDNPQWFFSEEQHISSEESSRIIRESKQLVTKILKTDVRDFGANIYGVKNDSEDSDSTRSKSIIGIVIGILVFAGLILSLIFKNLVIFGYIGCGVFLFAGISMLLTGKGEIVESSSRAVLNKVIGFDIALASLLLILLIYFRKLFAGAEVFILIFVITFGLSGITLLFAAVFRTVSGKLIYTREVTATCSGYVRYVSRDSDNHYRGTVFIHTSPLFSYSVDGVQYQAVWDEFVTKQDSDIALGQNVPIKVDPKHPENIKSPVSAHPAIISFEVFLAVAFVTIAIWLGIYTASGAAKNMKLETKWNPAIEKINGETESNLTKITDEMIQTMYKEKLGSDQKWYVETAVVASKETTDEGQAITFTDEAFNGILYKDGNAPEPGTSLIIFYTVDGTRLLSGKHYKRMFTTADPLKFEYSGSHTAFKTGG